MRCVRSSTRVVHSVEGCDDAICQQCASRIEEQQTSRGHLGLGGLGVSARQMSFAVRPYLGQENGSKS